MPKEFWAGLGFGFQQIMRWEVVALAAVEALCTSLVYAVMIEMGQEHAWVIDRQNGEARLAEAGLRLLLWLVTIALLSHLNGRIFGRPFPVGPVHATFRALKANILFGLYLAFLILLPVGAGVILMGHLPENPTTDLVGNGLGVLAVIAGLWLVLSNILYFPMVLYQGGGPFFEARSLLSGRRLRLGAMLLIVLVTGFAWTVTIVLPTTGLDSPASLIVSQGAFAFVYGPLDALIVGFYLDGAARDEGAAEGQEPAIA